VHTPMPAHASVPMCGVLAELRLSFTRKSSVYMGVGREENVQRREYT
jgi:hypothetical protein